MQARLRVGAPNDHFEQEADRVAEEVMRMGETGSHAAPSPRFNPALFGVQEKCAFCSSGGELCRECAEEEKLRRPTLDSAAAATGAQGAEPPIASPILHEIMNSPGRPLDLGARSLMESHFHCDFSQLGPRAYGPASRKVGA